MNDLMKEVADQYERWRRSDPDTSHVRFSADRTTQIQRAILDYMARYPGGVTDLDLQTAFNDHRATYRTRRAELVKMGKIKDSGRRMRQDSRKRILWVLV